MSEVDLSSLARAIGRLEEAVVAHSADPGNLLIRDALIKRFEFTWELSQSTLRRFVEAYELETIDPAFRARIEPDLIPIFTGPSST